MLRSVLTDKDFQACHLIDWQQCSQLIRSHAGKSLLTNMEFNMDFNPGPRGERFAILFNDLHMQPSYMIIACIIDIISMQYTYHWLGLNIMEMYLTEKRIIA